MAEFDELVQDLKQTRDEINLRIHLASMEVREEWRELEGKWNDFAARADVDRTAEGIGDALKQLGGELKRGFQRISSALRD